MNVLSLFDGISCGQLALQKANIKIDKYYSSEIKKFAIKCTQYHFPKTIQLGNVRNIKSNNLEKIDLLIGGSPCQDLSIGNVSRKGLKGEKSKLFWEYVRLLRELKPTYFLLENVASMPISQKNIISQSLGVEPIKINSNLVSFQNRNRLYWTNIPNVTIPKDRNIDFQNFKDYDEKYCDKFMLNKTTSSLKMWGDGKNGNCSNVTHAKKINCITTRQNRWHNAGLVEYKDFCRYLTIRELESGQTLPINYTHMLNLTQANNVIGDCWTVDVISHIFTFLK